MAAHTMFDGRLQIYRRTPHGPWQAAARVGGQRFRQSTGEDALDRAKDVAEEWYLDLRGKLRAGQIVSSVSKEKAFGEAAQSYLREVRVLAATVRSASYVKMLELRMNAHVLPFFQDKPLSAINKGLAQTYRVKRAEETIEKTTIKGKDGAPDTPGKPPARSTMLQEIVIIRQVLKHAEGLGWIPYVPSLSTPYMSQGKRGRRAWFSHDEYKQLYQATRRRIAKGKRRGWKSRYEDLHDFVLIMANTGLRPDEAWNLEFRDVHVEDDYATKDTILVIDVRGKTGVGYCKSMPGAVHPFVDLRQRREQKLKDEGKAADEITRLMSTMKVFADYNRALFNKILEEENLKFDRDGQRRTAYSLRHTYISMRLMEGANIHQIANNCRTSVQMIEQFYAAHIKDRLDAAAINVMRPKGARKAARKNEHKNQRAPEAHR
ncbi:MAG: site-specific integrase [Alphaproteobacteria bacterium]|nr:site-specific integrase [Alphaproteobacteria bacterium]MDE2494217.1 site-specific integrase [Alphaproteobacteria bacterium]